MVKLLDNALRPLRIDAADKEKAIAGLRRAMAAPQLQLRSARLDRAKVHKRLAKAERDLRNINAQVTCLERARADAELAASASALAAHKPAPSKAAPAPTAAPVAPASPNPQPLDVAAACVDAEGDGDGGSSGAGAGCAGGGSSDAAAAAGSSAAARGGGGGGGSGGGGIGGSGGSSGGDSGGGDGSGSGGGGGGYPDDEGDDDDWYPDDEDDGSSSSSSSSDSSSDSDSDAPRRSKNAKRRLSAAALAVLPRMVRLTLCALKKRAASPLALSDMALLRHLDADRRRCQRLKDQGHSAPPSLLERLLRPGEEAPHFAAHSAAIAWPLRCRLLLLLNANGDATAVEEWAEKTEAERQGVFEGADSYADVRRDTIAAIGRHGGAASAAAREGGGGASTVPRPANRAGAVGVVFAIRAAAGSQFARLPADDVAIAGAGAGVAGARDAATAVDDAFARHHGAADSAFWVEAMRLLRDRLAAVADMVVDSLLLRVFPREELARAYLNKAGEDEKVLVAVELTARHARIMLEEDYGVSYQVAFVMAGCMVQAVLALLFEHNADVLAHVLAHLAVAVCDVLSELERRAATALGCSVNAARTCVFDELRARLKKAGLPTGPVPACVRVVCPANGAPPVMLVPAGDVGDEESHELRPATAAELEAMPHVEAELRKFLGEPQRFPKGGARAGFDGITGAAQYTIFGTPVTLEEMRQLSREQAAGAGEGPLACCCFFLWWRRRRSWWLADVFRGAPPNQPPPPTHTHAHTQARRQPRAARRSATRRSRRAASSRTSTPTPAH